MNDHVISGLVRRRREMAGEVFALLGQVDALSDSLDALDRTLRLFDPAIELAAIPALQSRPKVDWALRGEVARVVFAILREALEPLSARELAAKVMAARGMDGEVSRTQLKRVRKCLDRQRARGTLLARSVSGELRWSVRLP